MYYYRYDSAEVSCCYKYLMFSYNIIFWLAGAAFIAVGFWAWSEKGVLLDLTQVTRLHGFDPVWLVLVVGGVTFILGFAGCVGALRENICLLKFFSGIIGFIFILELTAAVLAVVFQSQVREWINDFFLANIKAYRDDIDLQNLIDSVQRMNHCCGAQEPDDWNLNDYFSCTNTLNRTSTTVLQNRCYSTPTEVKYLLSPPPPSSSSGGSAHCQSGRSRKRAAAASVRRVCGSAVLSSRSRILRGAASSSNPQESGRSSAFADGRARKGGAEETDPARLGSSSPGCGGKTRTEARSVRSASRRPPARTPAFVPENGRIHGQLRWCYLSHCR
ncbi:Tetraspanin-14 [Larimichthys crocea]|nr:Tetraspanin-14 [Larimichthys crocea]